MGELLILFNFIYLCLNTIILMYSSYLDVKDRIIPLHIFKFLFFFIVIINFFEYLVFFNDFLTFFTIKILTFIILFLLSFILFLLKIIGGADGKIIIIIFLLIPARSFNPNIILFFFLIFCCIFSVYYLYHLFKNLFLENKIIFDFIIEDISNLSPLKRLFFKTFSSLIDFPELNKLNKNKLGLNYIFFNFNRIRLQILGYYKPPVIIIISICYFIAIFLIGI